MTGNRRHWHLRYAMHLEFPTRATPLFQHLAGSPDPVAQIAYAADIGFVAVIDNEFLLRAAAEQARIADALRRHSLIFDSFVMNPASPLCALASPNPSDLSQLKEDLCRALDAGARAEAKQMIVIAKAQDTLPFDVQLGRFADNLLGWALDAAERMGIRLCIEAVSGSRLPGVLVRRIADACALARMADGRLGVMFDTLHVATEGDDLAGTFLAAQPSVASVQIADSDRLEPGAGSLDLRSFLACVHDCGFDGIVALEHGHSAPGAEGERSSLARLQAIDALIGQHGA